MNTTPPTPFNVLSAHPIFGAMVIANSDRLLRCNILDMQNFDVQNPDGTLASPADTKVFIAAMKSLGWQVSNSKTPCRINIGLPGLY